MPRPPAGTARVFSLLFTGIFFHNVYYYFSGHLLPTLRTADLQSPSPGRLAPPSPTLTLSPTVGDSYGRRRPHTHTRRPTPFPDELQRYDVIMTRSLRGADDVFQPVIRQTRSVGSSHRGSDAPVTSPRPPTPKRDHADHRPPSVRHRHDACRSPAGSSSECVRKRFFSVRSRRPDPRSRPHVPQVPDVE